MYFDAVVVESNHYPIFNGTPQEVRDWLTEKLVEGWIGYGRVVIPGKTLRPIGIHEYLAQKD